MDKEFVPYQEALALKEIGFDEPCFAFFQVEYTELLPTMVDDDEEYRLTGYRTCSNLEMPKHYTSAPTFSQAFRWFREKHNLIFQINFLFNGNYQVVIHRNTHEYMELIQNLKHACVYEIPDNYSYEEAELACLIKLIEIVKK